MIERKYLHLILTQWFKAVFLIIFTIDPPLIIVIQQGITPYGILWYIINFPIAIFQNILAWQWYLLALDSIISIYLFQHVKLRVYIPFQITSLLFFEQGLQNVSVLWLSALGFINPIFIILSIITKLPVGWGWFDNPHVQYALHGHVTDYNHLRTYTYIGSWWAYPSLWWLKHEVSKMRKKRLH